MQIKTKPVWGLQTLIKDSFFFNFRHEISSFTSKRITRGFR